MDELKPCPFCGSEEPVVHAVTVPMFGGFKHWVTCDGCKAETAAADTMEEAVEIWNRRTQ